MTATAPTTLYKWPSSLQVHIIEAKDLAAADLGGTSDPCVYIYCLGRKKRTSVRYKVRTKPLGVSMIAVVVLRKLVPNFRVDADGDGVVDYECYRQLLLYSMRPSSLTSATLLGKR